MKPSRKITTKSKCKVVRVSTRMEVVRIKKNEPKRNGL